MNKGNNRMRAETGPMQFGDDWRGLFIRGDNAMAYVLYLEEALNNLESLENSDPVTILQLRGLLDMFIASNHHLVGIEPQRMKSFEECIL